MMNDVLNDVDPKEWGKNLWGFFDTIVASYPENPDAALKQTCLVFFTSFQTMLPCGKCRQHYKEYISANSIDLAVSTKTNLTHWIANLKIAVQHSTSPAAAPTSVVIAAAAPVVLKPLRQQPVPKRMIPVAKSMMVKPGIQYATTQRAITQRATTLNQRVALNQRSQQLHQPQLQQQQHQRGTVARPNVPQKKGCGCGGKK